VSAPTPAPPGRPPPRTLWSDLRAIDAALVPRVTALLVGIRDGWLALGRRLEWIGAIVYGMAGAARDLRSGSAEGGGVRASLRRLDERHARSGPLALVRDVPQIGVVALASLLTVAAITVAVRGGGDGSSDEANLGEGVPTVITPGATTVGPYPLERVKDYAARAHAQLVVRTTQSPNEPVYALADFESPLSPTDATAAVPGVVPVLLFIHVDVPASRRCAPNEGKAITTKLPDEAGIEFTKLAVCLEGEASALERQAATITGTNPAFVRQRESEERDARRYRVAATQLRASCACIVAMVVRQTPEHLTAIANSGSVRLIDPAQPGQQPADLCWVPLAGDRPVTTRCSTQIP
jgi:hypothetical protein